MAIWMEYLDTTMKCLRSICLSLVLMFGSVAWAGPPGTYQQESLALIEAIDNILVEHGYCQNRNDCIKKKLAFSGRTSTGVDVEVYQVTDDRAIQKILTVCASAYAKNQQQMDISLSIYRQSHEELMGFGKWYKKPFVSMQMKGEQQ
jgi:hypothetical protein